MAVIAFLIFTLVVLPILAVRAGADTWQRNVAQLVLISLLIAARRPSTHPSTDVSRSAFPSIPKAPAAPTR